MKHTDIHIHTHHTSTHSLAVTNFQAGGETRRYVHSYHSVNPSVAVRVTKISRRQLASVDTTRDVSWPPVELPHTRARRQSLPTVPVRLEAGDRPPRSPAEARWHPDACRSCQMVEYCSAAV